jgi:hypothetical protein
MTSQRKGLLGQGRGIRARHRGGPSLSRRVPDPSVTSSRATPLAVSMETLLTVLLVLMIPGLLTYIRS